MEINLILVAGVVTTAWAVLSVVGGERQKELNELQIEEETAKTAAERAAKLAAEPSRPVR